MIILLFREVYRQLARDKLKESNPKCPVTPNILSVPSEPHVEVTFSRLPVKRLVICVYLHVVGDDSVLHFETADMKAIEIISQINQKTKSL